MGITKFFSGMKGDLSDQLKEEEGSQETRMSTQLLC